MKWSATGAPDMFGKTVVVTGANSGLGFESARWFARAGAKVVLACRSAQKGEAARRAILAEQPKALLHPLTLDLQDLSSVARFAAQLERLVSNLHVLMNNAGIMNVPYGMTHDGFELQMGTNHLGHFALTGLVFELLRRTPGSRVVTVSSAAHHAAFLTGDDLSIVDDDLPVAQRRRYSPFRAYARSKLANLLFAFELQRRLEHSGVDCLSIAAHPGAAQTHLGRHVEGTFTMRALGPLLGRIVPSSQEGALSQLRASVDPTLRGGEYVGPRGLGGLRGPPVVTRSSPASRSARAAQALWSSSERLTSVAFPPRG